MRNLIKAAVLAATLATGFATPVQAAGRQEYVIVWYTDESHTTISGQRVHYCDGTNVRVGQPTLFEEEIYYGCG